LRKDIEMELADSLTQMGFELMLALGFFTLALWKKDILLDTASGIVLIFVGLAWVDSYTWLSQLLVVLGGYQFFNALTKVFTEKTEARGISQFKSLYQKLRGRP